MSTFFDVVTVTAFVAITLAYFKWGQQNIGLLLRLLVSGLAFAIANQLGNAGSIVIAFFLLLAGTSYAVLSFHRQRA